MGKRDHSPDQRKSLKKHHRESDNDSEDESPKVDNPISEDDFYTKSSEFIVWLREKKKLSLSDLSSKDARKYFAKFVKKWNRGSLNDKFYRGISTTDIASNQRSNFKWNFKVNEVDEQRLTEAKDSVHVMTATKLEAERRGRKDQGASGGSGGGGRGETGGYEGGTGPSSSGANTQPVGRRDRNRTVDEDMDPEDRARYERGLRKKEAKSFESTRQTALEEMAPKATGREAQIEKRKAVNAYHKQERDTDVSLNDSDLMGGGDSFAAHLARERQRKQRLEERRQPPPQVRKEIDSRIQSYQAKEDATMAMMRDLAKKFTQK
ncbi:UNVERIFIED_CONTAM: hypothetical protein HDU68_010123 [Siphonaria sp. JEL0065]|nr:hypothetical protein HDU68_010123 [Siphonaria sp. JEL0065]